MTDAESISAAYERDAREKDVNEINRRLDAIAAALGIPWPPPKPEVKPGPSIQEVLREHYVANVTMMAMCPGDKGTP